MKLFTLIGLRGLRTLLAGLNGVRSTVRRMSWVDRRHVYAVCGHRRHTDVEYPVTPSPRTPLFRRFKLILGRGELPTRPETIFMHGFCRECRAYYDFSGRTNFDLKTVILRYWAFKNWQRLANPIPPWRVPLNILFGEPSPRVKAELEAAKDGRLEIVMLLDQLACLPKTPLGETLARLELVRADTLDWATRPPSPFRTGQSHILNKMAEPKKDTLVIRVPQVHEMTLSALCGQTHTPTLAALCGDDEHAAPKEELDAETWEKIKGAWFNATGRTTIPVIEGMPGPVSRWSHSVAAVSTHPAEQSEEVTQEEVKPEQEPEVLLMPVCYKPEGNWI